MQRLPKRKEFFICTAAASKPNLRHQEDFILLAGTHSLRFLLQWPQKALVQSSRAGSSFSPLAWGNAGEITCLLLYKYQTLKHRDSM